MAGMTCEITKTRIGNVQKIKFDWLSDDATGQVSGATTFQTVGRLMRFTTIPGAVTPTALYDITVKDEDGVDILNGLGADRSATVTENKAEKDGLLFTAARTLTLAITGAGNAKDGLVFLYFLNEWDEPI